MRQWDTADWVLPAGASGPRAADHPCVIISPDAVCANPDVEEVNVIGGSSHRSLRQPGQTEFMLDSADGMDWETIIRLHMIWAAPKSQLRLRKTVTLERRRALGAKLIRVFGLLVP